MKVSESWLREWIDPPLSFAQIGHGLTMAGLEVESIEPVGIPFSGVVIGHIVSIEPHPNANKLRITQVDIGGKDLLQIVCGAANAATGLRVPVACVGAKLPDDIHIQQGQLRGVDSYGMLCGASELGLTNLVDGLMVLPENAPIGEDLYVYLGLNEQVVELSITPNRGDCFSVQGIARELAAYHPLPIKTLDIRPADTTHSQQMDVLLSSEGCPRYHAQIIDGINPSAQTPDYIIRRLQAVGLRPHSLVVDVTNYVMLELGQPLHAFDRAKIQGGLEVRLSRADETLILLNDQSITLDNDTLVIADAQQVLALAGIMGGSHSRVSDRTTCIVLESAFFDPLAIVGRARRYGLHTDASHRFERGVDFNLSKQALDYVTGLIIKYAGGHAGPVTTREQSHILPTRRPIHLSLAELSAGLGFTLPKADVLTIFKRLNLTIVSQNDAQLVVIAPSYRFDLTIAQDLTEEVARIYGYDNIPPRIPMQPMQLHPVTDRATTQSLTQLMIDLGYQEAVSFSFVDARMEQLCDPSTQPLALTNPISSELSVMRTKLLTSLIPCLQYNLNRQQTRVRLFEQGLRFELASNSALESLKQIPTLAILAVGDRVDSQWAQPNQPLDFFDIKADAETVLTHAGIHDASFEPCQHAWMHPGQSATIIYQQQTIGYVGRLHPALEKACDLPPTWTAQLDSAILFQPRTHRAQLLSRFPATSRDIAVIVSQTIPAEALLLAIKRSSSDLLIDTKLFDVYAGKGIASGFRSLAFTLVWQHTERTLEENEIKLGMQTIIEELNKQFSAVLRDT